MRPSPRIEGIGRVVVLAVSLTITLPACGGSDADSRDMRVEDDAAMDTTPAGTPAPPSLPALAEDARRQATVVVREWSVEPEADAVAAGETTFQAMNTGTRPHALSITGPGVEARTAPIAPGATATLTVALEPGTYRLFCPETDGGTAHAERGMSTPLVIR